MRRVLRAIALLAVNLVRNPGLLDTMVPWMTHPFTSAWKSGEPWWNCRAVRYMAERLPDDGRVFEWGSGASTVWFAGRGLDVTAVESEAAWAEQVSKRCAGATVRLIPGTHEGILRSERELRDRGRHFFDDYVAAIDDYPDGTFDVVIVDGICRAACAERAAAKVKPGGLVIVDDTNWDFLEPCFKPFDGWATARIRGFKYASPEVFETTFFRAPQSRNGSGECQRDCQGLIDAPY